MSRAHCFSCDGKSVGVPIGASGPYEFVLLNRTSQLLALWKSALHEDPLCDLFFLRFRISSLYFRFRFSGDRRLNIVLGDIPPRESPGDVYSGRAIAVDN